MGVLNTGVLSAVIVGIAANSILNPRFYVFHETAQTWDDAKRTCEMTGGTLAILHDISIMPDINDSIPQLQNQVTWIGLFFKNNVWKWTDNSVYDWSNWEPFSDLRDGNCVSVSLSHNYHWRKTVCDDPNPFFCALQQGVCTFRVYPNSSLSGYTILKRTEDIGYCLQVCEEATEIKCLSFEYSEQRGMCEVSEVNRWIKEDSYISYDPTWNYYHRTCVQASIWPGNDTLEFENSTIGGNITEPEDNNGTFEILEAHHYVVYNKALTWYAARDFCHDKGGILARVYDLGTITETGYTYTYEKKTVWIGLSRTPDTYWSWVGNSTLTWTNWKYPPKSTDRDEKCAMLVLDDDALWYPTVCQRELWFLCQFPADECVYSRTSQAAILANNNLIYNEISVAECQELCDNTTVFQCRSFEYFLYYGGICQLSQGNKYTLASYYKTNLFGWNYYHRHCNFGGPLPVVPTTSTAQPTTTTTMITTTTMMTTTTTAEPTTTTQPTTTEEPTTTESTSTETPTTTLKPTTTTKKTFVEIKEELVAMGNEIRLKRLKERRTSAVDNRPSATGAGVVATIILGSLIALVVFLDIGTIKATCDQHRRHRKRKRRPRPVVMDTDTTDFSFQMENYRKDSLLDDDDASDIIRVEREIEADSTGIGLSCNHVEIEMHNPEDSGNGSSETAIRLLPVRINTGNNVRHVRTQTEESLLERSAELWEQYRSSPTTRRLQLSRNPKSKSIETQTDSDCDSQSSAKNSKNKNIHITMYDNEGNVVEETHF